MNSLLKTLTIAAALAASPVIMTATPLPDMPDGFSDVLTPDIPESISFAGEKIDLSRRDYAERLDRELTSMIYTHSNTLLQIKRANRYFPIMAPILKKNGVPEDLLYLACIESILNPRAVSHAKAAGLWQFMPATGREYGLEVNEYVDERFDPEKSTEAACCYLKSARNRYKGWESAAASYNAGMGRISNELSNQGVSSAYELWLPDETMRYVFRLLAAKMLMENPSKYGFSISANQLYQPYEYRTVTVDTPVDDWAAWAKENGTNYYIVREHNPWIRSKSLPNKTGKVYKVRIPTDESMKRDSSNPSVYNKAWISR